MILIEGPDRTGKTTLSEMLGQLLPEWKRAHFGVPDRDVFEYHSGGILDAGARSVVDRLHWSEYAYGLTYRGRCGYSVWDWRAIERMLSRLRCTVVLMTDRLGDIESRWEGEPFDRDKVGDLLLRFDELRYGRSEPRSLFRPVVLNLRELTPELVQQIARDERRKFG